MTRTIDLGAPSEAPAPRKRIEFTHVVCADGPALIVRPTMAKPNEFEFVELVARDYLPDLGLDLMFAYDDPQSRGRGHACLGRWNDGVV